MKSNKLNKQIIAYPLFVLTMMISVFFIISCNKESGFSGTPVINSVRLLDSAKKDSTFVQALPGTQVLIEGQNLAGITNAYFNDFPAYFNPVYNTNYNLIITIPSNAPTEATNPDVPNTIRLVTTHGEAVYQFTLDIPPPVINAISNENALPGDSLIIWGSNLWLIEKIIFPGGKEVTDVNTTESGYRVGLIMPDLGDDTGRITIVAKYGTTASDAPLNDHQSGNVISNLTASWESGETSVFNWSWWGANRTNDASLFPGTRGGYLQSVFGGVGADDAAWWTNNRAGNFDEVPLFTEAVRTEQAENYALKFEINTKEPWIAGINLLRLGDNYAYRFMPWLNSTDKIFDTDDKWQTVTVPLSWFAASSSSGEGTGPAAASMADLVKPGGKVAFSYRIITTTDPIDLYNAAYDNFRIVKIK